MSNYTSPLYYNQALIILDTTQATSLTQGSLVLYGGLNVHCTTLSTHQSSGSIVVHGGIGIIGKLNAGFADFKNDVLINSTSESVDIDTGALVVKGGVGINHNLNVGGDTIIAGNLTVNGTTTSVNTTTLNIKDNTLLLNSGPTGTRDSGVFIQRYQVDNNSGSGDVVSETEPIAFTGTVVSTTTDTITFLETPTEDITKWWVLITSGSGVNQVRKITSYNSGTMTLSSSISDVVATDTFNLYNRSYFGSYYETEQKSYVLAYVSDIDDIKIFLPDTGYADLRANKIQAASITVGNLDATNLTAGNMGITTAHIENASIGNLVSNAATIGTLYVTGPSYLRGGTNTGMLNVSGNSMLYGFVTAGALNVTGATNLQMGLTAGTLNVTGDTLLNGAVTTGALNVTGE